VDITFDDARHSLLDIGGVWRHLLTSSGWCAMERGSDLIEPLDLLKAIYVVDIEHVSRYWDDWENYERFLLTIKLGNGEQVEFLNRHLILFQQFLAARENKGRPIWLGTPSEDLCAVAFAAKKIVQDRRGEEFPSSKDLLYCVCLQHRDLAAELCKHGLNFEKLERDVLSGNESRPK